MNEVDFVCSPPRISGDKIIGNDSLHNRIYSPCSPETEQASDYASSPGHLVTMCGGKRRNGAEAGSVSLLWTLEVCGLLSYFLKVETKSLLVAQTLGAGCPWSFL